MPPESGSAPNKAPFIPYEALVLHARDRTPQRCSRPLDRQQRVLALHAVELLLIAQQMQRLAQQQPGVVRLYHRVDEAALGGDPRDRHVEVVPLDELALDLLRLRRMGVGEAL